MPLPFDLPALSGGFAALTPAARETGAQVAAAAAGALSALLGRELSVRARACAGAPAPRAVAARLAIDLTAVPATALLEVDPSLVVALVDALAGGPGAMSAATALTAIEASALELFALAALDGACSVGAVEDALAPRLSRGGAEPSSPLALELAVEAGPIAGRARLLVPAAALRALADLDRVPSGPAPGLRLTGSVRSGRASLSEEELDALAPGDVVLLDPPGERADALVLPGGARFAGRLADGALHVDEVVMAERNAQLPVRLEVELARVEVTLAELARLEPGGALPLGIDRRGLVTLRVGDRVIARGELVDVEGAVGVRILSLEVGP